MRFRKDLMDSWVKDKKVFEYSDGTQDLFADPMEVLQTMNIFADGDLSTVRDKAFPAPVEVMVSEDYVDETGEPAKRQVKKLEQVPRMVEQPVMVDGKPKLGKDGKVMMEEVQAKHPDGQLVFDLEPEYVETAPDPDDLENFYQMIRVGFGIPPRDRTRPGGFTRPMLEELWNRFQGWLFEKKVEPGSSPTSSAPTEEASLPV